MKRIISSFMVLIMIFGIAFSMNVNVSDLFIKASAEEKYYNVGDIIEYGSYPQSEVTDIKLISILSAQPKEWISYGYDDSDYMSYADVSYKGYQYRAVTFFKYRTETGRNQLDNGFSTDAVYWFKYEPLKWQILDVASGLVLCNTVIDVRTFGENIHIADKFITTGSIYGTVTGYHRYTYYYDEDMNGFSSDYEHSLVRSWLNNNFYDCSFTDNQKNNIQLTTIDNTSTPTGYSSNNTTDKIFLISYNNIINTRFGFESTTDASEVRLGYCSDYAKCQGIKAYANDTHNNVAQWYLRTASDSKTYNSNVHAGCVINSINEQGAIDKTAISLDQPIGIRPAMKLSKIYSDSIIKHIEKDSVVENIVEATCTSNGSYDEVIYCEDCGIELSRETIKTDYAPHISASAIIENEIASTCDIKGTYDEVVYCSVCGVEMSREKKISDEFEHVASKSIKENKKDPTCISAGSYDDVIYCSICQKLLSKESKNIPAIGHTDSNNDGKCDVCDVVINPSNDTPSSDEQSKNEIKKVKIEVSTTNKTVKKYSKVSMNATSDLPNGYELVWYEGNKKVSNQADAKFITPEITESKTYTIKIEKDGKVVSDPKQEIAVTINVAMGFFNNISGFFSKLFGRNIINL